MTAAELVALAPNDVVMGRVRNSPWRYGRVIANDGTNITVGGVVGSNLEGRSWTFPIAQILAANVTLLLMPATPDVPPLP